jgi:hypothetical protein
VTSPLGCRSGHISAFAEATLPRDGQVGEGVSPALDAQTEKHNDPRRSTATITDRESSGLSQARAPCALIHEPSLRGDTFPPRRHVY